MKPPKNITLRYGKKHTGQKKEAIGNWKKSTVGKFQERFLDIAKKTLDSKGFKLEKDKGTDGEEETVLVFKPKNPNQDFDPAEIITNIAILIYRANGILVTYK